MKKHFDNFGVMLDCSRNAVPTVSFLKQYIDDIALMGYNSLQLYTEDTYEVDGEPLFGYLRGRFTKNELKEINAYGKTKGVELIPCIQTLAHLGCLVKWYPYSDYCDCDNILLIDDDRTYALIEKMFKTARECFDSKYINIGMDEAHFVGLGKYLNKHGYHNRFDLLARHLSKVVELAKKYDFKPIMWSDMFFRLADNGRYGTENPVDIPKDLIEKVPQEVSLCFWDYYGKSEKYFDNMLKHHKMFNNEIWFAGGCWSWGGFTPSNFTSMESHELSIPACIKHGVRNAFITIWGDNGHETSKLANYSSLYHASCLADGITDMKVIAKQFEELFGMPMEDYSSIDNANQLEKKNSIYDLKGANANNPSKYMFYNDLFVGDLDSTVSRVGASKYKRYAKELLQYVNHEKFGYVFDVQQKLCEVLAIKYPLGAKTRKAYLEKDIEALKKLIKQYKLLGKKLVPFYDAFKKQWFKENKGFGWELQDARIGGLMQRVKSCMERLQAYVNGEIDAIEELEAEIYPPFNDKKHAGKTTYRNDYLRSFPCNPNFA
jgi:hypothetical protein